MATEKRLIDADEFLKWVVKRFKCVPLVGSCDNDSESMKLLLAQAPTVDAVEVVRCKDCKHCCLDLSGRDAHLCMRKEIGFIVRRKADDFRSYGERKDNP